MLLRLQSPLVLRKFQNPAFVAAVKETGKKTLIMAGTLSNVCLAFPAICAVHEGFRVYALMDASGCWSKFSKDIALARMVHAGVIPTDTLALIAEIQQTWARPDAQVYAELYAERMPNYRLLMECFDRAASVTKHGEQDAKQTTSLYKMSK
jgi:hypothetical protein